MYTGYNSAAQDYRYPYGLPRWDMNSSYSRGYGFPVQTLASPIGFGMGFEEPCPTLFISNLPPDVTERELNLLFRFAPGFLRLRLVTRESRPTVCFADFVDTNTAAMARSSLHGFQLDPSKKESTLRVEFDRGTRASRSLPPLPPNTSPAAIAATAAAAAAAVSQSSPPNVNTQMVPHHLPQNMMMQGGVMVPGVPTSQPNLPMLGQAPTTSSTGTIQRSHQYSQVPLIPSSCGRTGWS